MLQNAYFLAKIGADTAENERNLPKIGNYPTRPSRTGEPLRAGYELAQSDPGRPNCLHGGETGWSALQSLPKFGKFR